MGSDCGRKAATVARPPPGAESAIACGFLPAAESPGREPDADGERVTNLGSSKIHILNYGPRPGGAGWAWVENETRTAGRHDGGRTS